MADPCPHLDDYIHAPHLDREQTMADGTLYTPDLPFGEIGRAHV